jgi:hypothetical protein
MPWINGTHQSLDEAECIVLFEVGSVNVVDTQKPGRRRVRRLRSDGLLAFPPWERSGDDDKLRAV